MPAGTAGVRWRGLLPVAVDGTIMTVADTAANLAVYSKQKGGRTGGSSYPFLSLVALVSCGTRPVIDAVFGPACEGETACAARLPGALAAGMILLGDRGFGAGLLAAQVKGTGADFLIRVRTGRSAPGRDQVILAAGITTGAAIDLAGRIGERVLAVLMPARRLRTSPRVVKRAISKHNARGTIDRATRKAAIDIKICAAPSTGGNAPLTTRPCG